MALSKNVEVGSSALDVKIVVIGESGVGKTSFIRAFYDNHEPNEMSYVNGWEVYSCTYETNHKHGKVEIFEAAAIIDIEEYRMENYVDANAIIFMYACDDLYSFRLIEDDWLPEAIDLINSNRISVVVVGTKKDLQQDEQVVENLDLNDENLIYREYVLLKYKEILSPKMFLECCTDDLEAVNKAFDFIFDFASPKENFSS